VLRGTIVAITVVGAAAAVGAAGLLSRRAQSFSQGRISPHESVSGTVDDAKLTIVYGRPSMRGRVIFGSLVPWGRVWCPGADEATTLESSRPIAIGQLRVPMGPHTIWILPTRDRWTFIVSKEPEGFHTRYNASADLGRVVMSKRALDAPVERLTFAIDAAPSGGGTIAMTWEKTDVSVPFSVVR